MFTELRRRQRALAALARIHRGEKRKRWWHVHNR